MDRAIGVFDSGIGGLSVLKALRTELPTDNFIYVSDSGHAPYGERDEAHVLARSQAIASYLVNQNIKALVIACNTATAASIKRLRGQYPLLPIIGVEPALKPAVALSQTGRIGIIATRSTLTSAKFTALLELQSSPSTFVVQPCDGLADAIERSAIHEDATEIIAICDRYTRAMGTFGHQHGQIDTLVLGCTHYSFVKNQLRALLGPEVQLVDTAEAVARQTRRLLNVGAIHTDPGAALPTGNISLLTTGDPHILQAAASRWLGLTSTAIALSI